MKDVFRIVYNPQDLVIVDEPDLAAVDGDTGSRITAKDDPVALLAPRARRELALVGIRNWTDLQNVAAYSR